MPGLPPEPEARLVVGAAVTRKEYGSDPLEQAKRDYQFRLDPAWPARCASCRHFAFHRATGGQGHCTLLDIEVANAHCSRCPVRVERGPAPGSLDAEARDQHIANRQAKALLVEMRDRVQAGEGPGWVLDSTAQAILEAFRMRDSGEAP